jgi:mono/diheme cytochrome c family protein
MARKHSTWHVETVKLRYALGLAACAALAGCEKQPVGGSTDGAKVFHTICAACHGPKGKPPESAVATTGVKDLTAPELRHRITPALVENQVRKGSQNKLMPAFEGALSDEQIKAVAAYVASPEFLGGGSGAP